MKTQRIQTALTCPFQTCTDTREITGRIGDAWFQLTTTSHAGGDPVRLRINDRQSSLEFLDGCWLGEVSNQRLRRLAEFVLWRFGCLPEEGLK